MSYFFLLSTSFKIIFIIWFLFIIAVLSTIPLLLSNKFKNKKFYQTYNVFWRIGTIFFTSITAIPSIFFYNALESTIIGILLILLFYFVTCFVTLFPAYLQNKYYSNGN